MISSKRAGVASDTGFLIAVSTALGQLGIAGLRGPSGDGDCRLHAYTAEVRSVPPWLDGSGSSCPSLRAATRSSPRLMTERIR